MRGNRSWWPEPEATHTGSPTGRDRHQWTSCANETVNIVKGLWGNWTPDNQSTQDIRLCHHQQGFAFHKSSWACNHLLVRPPDETLPYVTKVISRLPVGIQTWWVKSGSVCGSICTYLVSCQGTLSGNTSDSKHKCLEKPLHICPAEMGKAYLQKCVSRNEKTQCLHMLVSGFWFVCSKLTSYCETFHSSSGLLSSC